MNLHFGNVRHDSVEEGLAYSEKQYTEMFKLMVNHLNYENAGIICDRAHLGEMVYGPIYRGYTGEYVLDIEKRFSKYNELWDNLFLIVLTDHPENLIKREDGHSFSIDLDKKQNEINNFINAYEKSTIKNKLHLNVHDYDIEHLANTVIDYIEKTQNESL